MSKLSERGRQFLDRGRREGEGLLRDDLLRARGGWVVGAKGGFGSVRSQASASTDRIRTLATAAFRRDTTPSAPLNSSDLGDRFAEAMDVYGRDDAYVAAVQDNKYRVFLLYIAMAVGLLGIDIATWASYRSNVLLIAGHISPIIPALALAAQSAFINWQFRNRRLDGFVQFVRNPSVWWPEQTPEGAARGRAQAARPAALVLVAATAAATAIMGSAPAAHAQTSPVTTGSSTVLNLFSAPSSTDLWGRLLGMVFPGIGPLTGPSSPVSVGITNGFSSLIAVLMAVGALMLSWFTIVGSVNTAHEGRVLGQRWHLTWAPVRVVYGFASLAPVVKGYCLLQILVIWLAVASGAMGNVIWNGFVSGLTSGALPTPDIPETMDFVKRQLGTEVCFSTAEQVASSYGVTTQWPATFTTGGIIGSGEAMIGSAFSDVTTAITGNGAYTNPASVYHYYWNYGDCGTVSVNLDTGSGSSLGTLANAQLLAVDHLRAALRPIADSIVATTEAGATGTVLSTLSQEQFQQVVNAKASYDSELSSANSAYVSSSASGGNDLTAFQTAAQSGGWIMAGPYYMTIARINTAFLDATKFMPTVGEDALSSNAQEGTPLAERLYGGNPYAPNPNSTWSRFQAWWQSNLDLNSSLTPSAAAAGTLTSNSAWSAAKWAASPSSGLQSGALWFVKLNPNNFDGIQQMVDMGDHLMDVAEALGAGVLIGKGAIAANPEGRAAGFATSISSKMKATFSGGTSGMLSGTLSFAGLFMGIVAVSVLASAVFDSLILPMLPFIHFLFAVMGCLIIVCEAVAAAPLWALAHIRLDGQEMHDGPQKAGYQILFNLIWRIPLTLMGLLFSFLVFDAMIWLLSVTIYPAMESATSDSLFGVVGTIVYIVLITSLNWGIATRAFSLCHQFPDRVTRWFGGSDGSDESREAHTAVGMVRDSSRGALSKLGDAGFGAGIGGRGRSQAKSQVDRAKSDTPTPPPPPGGGGGGTPPGGGGGSDGGGEKEE